MGAIANKFEEGEPRVGAPSGVTDEERTRRLAEVLTEVAAFSAKPPPREVEAAHVSAMTDLAREITQLYSGSPPAAIASGAKRGIPPHKRFAAGLIGPFVAAPLCVVALALAGVRIPEPIRAPLDAAHIRLPNQAGGGLETVAAPSPNLVATSDVAAPASWAIHHTAGGKGGSSGQRPDQGSSELIAANPATPPEAVHETASTGGPPGSSSGATAAPSPAPVASTGPPAKTSPQGSDALAGLQPSKVSGVAKTAGQPTLPLRPGKGCGDPNHLHARVDECH